MTVVVGKPRVMHGLEASQEPKPMGGTFGTYKSFWRWGCLDLVVDGRIAGGPGPGAA